MLSKKWRTKVRTALGSDVGRKGRRRNGRSRALRGNKFVSKGRQVRYRAAGDTGHRWQITTTHTQGEAVGGVSRGEARLMSYLGP